MNNQVNSTITNQKHCKLPLDYAARFYPITATRKSQSLYVMGANMKEDVDPIILKQAANEVVKKFPSMAVTLKRGYAWYYFVHNDAEVDVFPLDGTYLKLIDGKDTNGYQFRIYYGKRVIEVELFHGLTDGNGAFVFLQELITRYRELQGADFEADKPFGYSKEIDFGNIEDGFEKYYKPLTNMDLKGMAGGKPHKVEGTLLEGDHNRIHYSADAIQIKNKAKEYGASFNSYMAGVIAYSLEQISQSKHPIVIMIPVNLRAVFPTNTIRNFVTFVRIIIKPNSCKELKDYVEEAHLQLKEKATKNKLEQVLFTTVKAQQSLFLKMTPVFVKRLIVKIGKFFMKSRQTIIFSNLGRLTMPENFGVESFTFNMNASKNNPQNLGIITFNDTSIFTFISAIKELDFPNKIVETLKNENIDVKAGI